LASLDDNLQTLFPNLTPEDVRDIVDTDLEDPTINAFLNMAYYRTRPLHGNLTNCGGESMEEQIIAMLAAHFVKVNEGDPYDEWVGTEWRVRYRGTRDGEGFRSTVYGQQAIAMDCSGKLASAGLRQVDLFMVDTDRAEEYDIVVD